MQFVFKFFEKVGFDQMGAGSYVIITKKIVPLKKQKLVN